MDYKTPPREAALERISQFCGTTFLEVMVRTKVRKGVAHQLHSGLVASADLEDMIQLSFLSTPTCYLVEPVLVEADLKTLIILDQHQDIILKKT